MLKSAKTQYPILPAISERWSPRSFSPQVPDKAVLMRLFEAARWAPSAMNAQPWYFIIGSADTPDTHQKIFSTLRENNQRWAQHAPVLVLAVMNALRENGQPHRWAAYDLGQSVANLSIQATAEGLSVHQMGGFDREKAAELFHLPEGYEAMTAIAIGYAGSADALSGETYEQEVSPRTRKGFSEFIFGAEWGKPF